jgi:hypothetical protein
MPHDIFLSYRSEDKAAVDRLCAALESRGIQCWVAPRDIPAATEWPVAIVEAINACKLFLVVLSSNSKNAKQISREAELADKNGAQIITFRIENVEPPPGLTYFLGNIQWLDAFNGQFEAAVAKVAELVKKAPVEAMPIAVPAAPRGKPSTQIGLIAAAVIFFIAVAAWFALRPQALPVDDASQAKFVAERFLSEREAGNLDAAWKEYNAEFRNRISKTDWLNTQAKLSQHGHETHTYNGCKPEGEGYLCDYTLTYQDGTNEDNRLTLVKNGSGGWVIATGSIKVLHK